METAMVQINADKISKLTGFEPEAIAVIKNSVAKGTTDVELAYFLSTAKSVNLNPLMREIWCYKDNKGNLLVFAGRDGFLKRAQESPLWNGMTSFEVCKNDEFRMDVTAGQVHHVPAFPDRGPIIGAYAIIRPRGAEYPTVEWADFGVYNKGYNVWKSDPAAMIKKVAETHALKRAFGVTVLETEYDYNIKNDVVLPLAHAPQSNEQRLAQIIIAKLDEYPGEDREEIRAMCAEKMAANEFTEEFARGVAKTIGAEL